MQQRKGMNRESLPFREHHQSLTTTSRRPDAREVGIFWRTYLAHVRRGETCTSGTHPQSKNRALLGEQGFLLLAFCLLLAG